MQEELSTPIEGKGPPPTSRRRGLGRPAGSKDQKPRRPRWTAFRHRQLTTVRRPSDVEGDALEEDAAWSERGQYWIDTSTKPAVWSGADSGRHVERSPLVLNGHGVRLRIHQGSLLVQNGFTHYPQAREEYRFFPGDCKLPSRIILLDSDGSITLDVIAWLSEQMVPLVMLSWRGELVSLVGDGAAYDPQLREAQLAARSSGRGLEIATGLIREKIRNSRETLGTLPGWPGRGAAMDRLGMLVEELVLSPPGSVDMLRLVEARAAAAYFGCWQDLPLYWKGTGRKPIPQDWRQVGLRQSLLSGSNRNATHPVNAILNYAYGVLESQVRQATVTAGLDPTIGYLHTSRPGRMALVYDLMEPLRPQIDRLVLDFLRQRVLSASDIILTPRGVCRLHPHFARRVAMLAVDNTTVRSTAELLVIGLTNSE